MANSIKKETTDFSRDRILSAAVRLFARKGYGNTGLRELAAAADVNLAMVNYFFGSKKGLLKEILDIFFSGYLDIAQREMDGDSPLPIKLDRFIHSAVYYFAAHSDYLLVTIAELPHDDPEITEHKAAWGSRMVETIGGQLTAEGRPTAVQSLPPVIFCSMLTSLMASRFLFTPVMDQVQPDQLSQTSIDQYADIVSTIFLKGAGSVIGLRQ